jgi:death-on-curing protein
MAKLHYLTLQDMIWINLQVAERVVPFDFARLEDGSFFQYGYGKSQDAVGQGARFGWGFARKRPFEEGNEATGFIAFVAFLRLNGLDFRLGDAEAADWMRRLWAEAACPDWAKEAIAEVHGHAGHEPSVEETVRGVIADYPATIAALSGSPART